MEGIVDKQNILATSLMDFKKEILCLQKELNI